MTPIANFVIQLGPSLQAIFALLVVYQLKHLICDYFLQTPYMLGKFRERGWAAPLAAHALVHAMATDVIAMVALLRLNPGCDVMWVGGWAWLLGTFDFVTHFTMDRIKASPQLMGRWKPLTGPQYASCQEVLAAEDPTEIPYLRLRTGGWTNNHRLIAEEKLRDNTKFWYSIGIDQGIHHITHYAIIAVLLTVGQ